MNRRTIRIGFVDFWSDFNCHNNHFVKALESKYDLIIDNRSPVRLAVGILTTTVQKYILREKIWFPISICSIML